MVLLRKEVGRIYRHQRMRRKIIGNSERPRVCVHRSLNNFYVQVIDDAVSSRAAINRDIALAQMRQMGVALTSMEAVVCELMGTADHPNFREVMSNIKR